MRGLGRLAGIGILLAGAACYPGDGPSNVQDLDVVLTLYDTEVDFSTFRTFAMPDSVVHVGSENGDNLIDLPRTYDDLILELAAENMASAGFIREPNPEENGADLVLLVGALGSSSEYWVYQDWWYYWGWYPGWGYPGYPGYGPGWGWYYPPYVGTVKFESGSIVLTLVDPTLVDGEDIPVIWTGVTRGLLEGGGAQGRITYALNQMFTQSPYLGR
jgi:hypothetical protein